MQLKAPPQNELELLENAEKLAGKTLAEIAWDLGQVLPNSFKQAKGFVGQLIEIHLGASAGNKPLPDFVNLGIELKTLPYNLKGEPQETTYVCTAPLSANAAVEHWQNSRVRKKLAQILWIPIEADPTIPIQARKVGSPLLFKLANSPALEESIQKDWEELMNMLHLGNIAQLTANYGMYLQIRPKAANSKVLISVTNIAGEEERVGPKGFYLRKTFTQKILRDHFCF